MDTALDSLHSANAFLDDITTITKSTLEKHEEETERNIKTTRQKKPRNKPTQKRIRTH